MPVAMAVCFGRVVGKTAALWRATGHPRNWGAYPRFLRRYVRDQKLVGWGEAVRKMAALPTAMAEQADPLVGGTPNVTVLHDGVMLTDGASPTGTVRVTQANRR